MLYSKTKTTEEQRQECPHCKVLYADGLDRCPNCGEVVSPGRHAPSLAEVLRSH